MSTWSFTRNNAVLSIEWLSESASINFKSISGHSDEHTDSTYTIIEASDDTTGAYFFRRVDSMTLEYRVTVNGTPGDKLILTRQ